MNPAAVRHSSTSWRGQRGFSLVELMVASVVGLLVIAGVTALTLNTNRTNAELARVSRQMDNGRFAMHLLGEEIRHAGYFGSLHELGDPPSTLPDPCSVTQVDLENGVSLPVQAHTSAGDLSCLSAGDHVAGTDILVLRRTASEPTLGLDDLIGCPSSDTQYDDYFQAGHAYIQAQPRRFIAMVAGGSGLVGTGKYELIQRDFERNRTDCPSPIYVYRTHIYYLAPSTVASSPCPDSMTGDARAIPTLMRLRRDLTGNWCSESLVEGVQDIQYDFGIDRSGNGVPNADGSLAAYVPSPADTAAWSNVMAVQVNLLARTEDVSPGHADEKVYRMSMDGTVTAGPFDDAFRRRVFSGLVRLVNPAGRREG